VARHFNRNGATVLIINRSQCNIPDNSGNLRAIFVKLPLVCYILQPIGACGVPEP
jgi:hypothetical protein